MKLLLKSFENQVDIYKGLATLRWEELTAFLKWIKKIYYFNLL